MEFSRWLELFHFSSIDSTALVHLFPSLIEKQLLPFDPTNHDAILSYTLSHSPIVGAMDVPLPSTRELELEMLLREKEGQVIQLSASFFYHCSCDQQLIVYLG